MNSKQRGRVQSSEAGRQRDPATGTLRILVAAACEAGSHWANTINTTKMAEGFAALGHEVHLVCRAPSAGAVPVAELESAYGLRHRVGWTQLKPRLGARKLGPHWAFGLQGLAVARRVRPDLVFARNYVLPALSAWAGVPTMAETHAHTDNVSMPFRTLIAATRRASFRRLVTIGPVLARHYIALGVPDDKILVLPDAVDIELFAPPARGSTSPYRGPGPHVVYSGHLYDYKGIPTILEAAALRPGIAFHLVGGWDADLARQRDRAERLGLSNVTFHGRKRHADVPPYLWHANALLLPPSAQHPSAAWTSPVKLGEYLAAGPAVVASRIPALEHWLDESTCEFFIPDDGDSLVVALDRALGLGRDVAAARRAAALRVAQRWSYAARARRVLAGPADRAAAAAEVAVQP